MANKFDEVIINLTAEQPYVQFCNRSPYSTEYEHVAPAEVGDVIAKRYDQLSRTTTVLIATDNGNHPTDAKMFMIQGHFATPESEMRQGMYFVEGFSDVAYSGVRVMGEKNAVLAGLVNMPLPMVEGKADQVELRASLQNLASIPAVEANMENFPQRQPG
ncbi:MAG: hypothetical protein J0L97_10480 [Alphaproteobacteria bacterium]|nr:hypothetical protein [Alphaproteobacteria bacterium]